MAAQLPVQAGSHCRQAKKLRIISHAAHPASICHGNCACYARTLTAKADGQHSSAHGCPPHQLIWACRELDGGFGRWAVQQQQGNVIVHACIIIPAIKHAASQQSGRAVHEPNAQRAIGGVLLSSRRMQQLQAVLLRASMQAAAHLCTATATTWRSSKEVGPGRAATGQCHSWRVS